MAGHAHAADTAAQVVPDTERLARWPLMMMWWGLCSAMFYIFVGAALATQYGAGNALLAMALSVAAFAVLTAIIASFSMRSGLSVTLMSQAMFGIRGGALVAALLFLSASYYAVFEGSVLAVAAAKVIPGVSYAAACLLVVALSAPLALGKAQVWLDKLNTVLLPLYLAGLAALMIMSARRMPTPDAWLHIGSASISPQGWWPCFVTYMGLWLIIMVSMDFARFGRPKDARFHAAITFGAPFYLATIMGSGVAGLYLIAALPQGAASEVAVVDSTLALLGGGLGLAFIWGTQTRINLANYYLATVNLQALSEGLLRWRAPKWACLAVVAVAVALLMRASDVFSWLIAALNFQGVFIAAWLGTALAYIGRRGQRGAPVAAPWRIRGLAAWFVGAAIGFALLASELRAFASPAAAAAAGVVHLLLLRSVAGTAETTGILQTQELR